MAEPDMFPYGQERGNFFQPGTGEGTSAFGRVSVCGLLHGNMVKIRVTT
jgi:hypothetical protein